MPRLSLVSVCAEKVPKNDQFRFLLMTARHCAIVCLVRGQVLLQIQFTSVNICLYYDHFKKY